MALHSHRNSSSLRYHLFFSCFSPSPACSPSQATSALPRPPAPPSLPCFPRSRSPPASSPCYSRRTLPLRYPHQPPVPVPSPTAVRRCGGRFRTRRRR